MKHITYLSLLFVTHVCFAQKAQKIDSLFTQLYNQEQFNGNVLVIENGQEILKKSYGIAQMPGTPLNENTVFELASVSKQFTAMAIVLLKERKLLDYNDKLSKYIPELAFYDEITIKHLLNHTGGLPDYRELVDKAWDPKKIATNEDIIRLMQQAKDTLLFNPGSNYEYSNTGYALLSSIIERVSKQSYADFLAENIFKPLKMTNSFVYRRRFSPKKVKNYAYGYVFDDNRNWVIPDSVSYMRYVYYLDGITGDGTVNSTANDLVKWYTAIKNNTLISPQSLREITAPEPLPDGSAPNYSFGFRIINDSEHLILNHSGGWPGYVTYIEMDLKTNTFFTVLQNFHMGVLPSKNIREILQGKPMTPIYKKEIKLDKSAMEKFAGDYVDKEDSAVVHTIKVQENTLVYSSGGQTWEMVFYPESPSKFFVKSNRMHIGMEFVPTGDHKTEMKMLQDDQEVGSAVSK